MGKHTDQMLSARDENLSNDRSCQAKNICSKLAIVIPSFILSLLIYLINYTCISLIIYTVKKICKIT